MGPVHMLLVTLGALTTLAGALGLVLAFRRSQTGDVDGERRLFRLAVGGLAVGSLLFFAAVAMNEAA